MVEPMRRFYLFWTGQAETLLRELQKASLVEIEELPAELGFSLGQARTGESGASLEKLETIRKVIGENGSGKVVLTREEEERVVKETPLEVIARLADQFRQKEELLTRREKKLMEMDQELQVIEKLDLPPAELLNLKGFAGRFYTLPEDKLETLAEKIEVVFEVLQRSRKKVVIAVILPTQEIETKERQLISLGASPLSVTRYHRRPNLIRKRVQFLLNQVRKEKEHLLTEREKLASWREKVLVLTDWYRSQDITNQGVSLIGRSKFVQGMAGWVPESALKDFERLASKFLPEHCLVTRLPLPEEKPPVKLANPPLITPFEVVTDLYGRPAYGGIDPTGPLSFFFALCFAYCLTDAAYGLILAALSFFLARRFRYQPSLRKFFHLFFISGLVTTGLGTVTGGWFGDLLVRLPASSLIGNFLKKLVLLNPLGGSKETFLFLGIALALGYIQIVWGLLINLWKSHHSLRSLGEASLLLLIQLLVPAAGLALFLFKWGAPVVIFLVVGLGLCFLGLALLKAAEQKEFMLKLFWAFYAPYNVIAGNLLGDPLSYCRLFGLGLTTGLLALAVNEIVFLARGVPYVGFLLAGVIFLTGHLANLAINLLGSYVHSSRLQYLEFFSKFFEGGGRVFQPFNEGRKHTILKEKV
ncbi:MAG: hypothetical protein NC823_00495 [Candidatus Omnitrophica bacterium]|nr:hypothetical protein [Candidatus Omnitrophota bacterium]